MQGVMGKILWVNLTTGEVRDERLPDEMYEQYLGGYGIGARLLYDRMPAKADPLGPDNIFGIVTGPLTGTAAVTGNRFTAIGKSPKTHTWGDANCGGTFGPALKFAGYDGVFVTGASPSPVYLFIDDGRAELRDASDIWNQGDDLHPERVLKERHGRGFEAAWIGRAGETMSLTAGVMNDIGRAAARSGLGAVMGSKKLKAIVAGGTQQVPLHDPEALRLYAAKAVKDAKAENTPIWQFFTEYGTTGGVAASAASGDSPVKNWAGVGTRDFPEAFKISDVALDEYKLKRTGCWHCNIACSAHMRVPGGKYETETHRPEYETLAAAGTMTLSNDIEAMHKFNDVCNFYGMDTITAGSIVAYAMEAYERGYLTGEDTDGIELVWGNSDAVVEMTKKLGRREGRLGQSSAMASRKQPNASGPGQRNSRARCARRRGAHARPPPGARSCGDLSDRRDPRPTHTGWHGDDRDGRGGGGGPRRDRRSTTTAPKARCTGCSLIWATSAMPLAYACSRSTSHRLRRCRMSFASPRASNGRTSAYKRLASG